MHFSLVILLCRYRISSWPGTYNDPWDLSFSFAQMLLFGLHIWMETGIDGTTLVKTRAYGDYELQFNSNNNQIHFALDLDFSRYHYLVKVRLVI